MQKKLLLLILSIILRVWLPGVAYAQDPDNETAPAIDWRELRTENFIVVYAESVEGFIGIGCACGVEEAEVYTAFIDQVYKDLVAVFEVELETPINLRLFPTEESYYEVNPLAEQISGVIAHALNSREEIAIALPRTRPLSEEEIANNIRHELTHFFASFLSDSKLNTGFQEGIAQYLEKPVDSAGNNPAALSGIYQEERLLTWAQLNDAEQVFGEPDVAYPQALSMTAFLIDRYGFPDFLEFIKASATEPGYRSALEAAYGESADVLEAEWLEYLPEYLAGRWQVNSIYAYDLSRVTQLVEHGAYSDAETELIEIITLLESTDQTETLTEAEALLAKANKGQVANALGNETRESMLASDYALTISKANAAIAAYEELGYRDRIPEIQIYIQRAELGQNALAQLDYGEELLDSFRFFEAEKQIYNATALLQSLNNQIAAQRGEELLAESTFRQSIFAYAMLLIGLILLLLNGLRRILRQFSANPLEAEYI